MIYIVVSIGIVAFVDCKYKLRSIRYADSLVFDETLYCIECPFDLLSIIWLAYIRVRNNPLD